MTYKEIRDQFCEVSGRYDLILATGEDNGADFFLNAGQRYLDRSHKHAKAEARNVQPVIVNQVKVQVAGLRAVKEVWWTNAAGEMVPLSKCTVAEIKDYYGQTLTTITGAEVPSYYAPASFRPSPDAITAAAWTGYLDIDDLILDDAHYLYNGVVIAPKPLVAGYLSIVGLFYSPTLSAVLSGGSWVQTQSYWTLNHPEMLVQAAMLQLHGMYKDKSAFDEVAVLLKANLFGLDLDDAEVDAAGTSQMGG